LHRHLGFDLVDFFERRRTIVRFGRQAALKERWPETSAFTPRRFTAADFPQHVELSFAHEVVAPLALNHFLERGLAVITLPICDARIKIRPTGGRMTHKLHHLGQEAAVEVVLGHEASVSKWKIQK